MPSTELLDNTVSVLGLGAMGKALARALLRGGCQVTVWNRSPRNGIALGQEGASIAATAAEAISASRLTITCMIDKQATEEVLQRLPEELDLSGCTIVNLSTGSVADVKRLTTLVNNRHGEYLDGGIMCYPKDIGATDTAILYAGNEAAYHQHEPTLRKLAGRPTYLGSDPCACAPTYLALYATYFGALAAWMEGAVLASTAGVGIQTFERLSSIVTDMLIDGVGTAANRIAVNDYSGDQASINVHIAGQEIVLQGLKDAKAPHATTDAYLSYCKMAQDQRMGELDIACLFKAMHP